MSNTPMEDLLKPVTDEVEESPDNPTPATTEAATPASEPPKEKTDSTTPAATSPTDPANTQGDGEEEGKRRMTALPKWAHERLRANDTKAEAADRARQAAEQAAETARAEAEDLRTYSHLMRRRR